MISNRKMAGVDIKIFVNGSPIGGQAGATLNRENIIIDTSHKNNEGLDTAITRLKGWSVECEGFTPLADTTYLELLEAYESGQALTLEIKHKAYKGFYYMGRALVQEFPEEYDTQNAVKYRLILFGVSNLKRVYTTKEE